MAYGFDVADGNMTGASEPVGMRVSIMSETGKMKTVWLHGAPEGRYSFGNEVESLSRYFYIEGKNGKWYACCNEPAVFTDREGKTSSVAELYDQCLLPVGHLETGCLIYAEAFSHSSSVFHNYQVKREADISIGRTDNNDIAYRTAYVSKHHAIIRLDRQGWTVRDYGNDGHGSVNGVFVNGERIQDNGRGIKAAPLKVGDTVDIMCARIIIGIGFISVNVDENRIRVTSDKLKQVSSTDLMGFLDVPHNNETGAALFNRLPRRRTALEPSKIEIKAPPMSLNSNNIPMLLRMGGSMVMSSTSMLAGNFTMMISSVLFPILTQRYTDKQRKDYETRRNSRYKEYLNTKSVEIQREVGLERSTLCENYPELSAVLNYAEDGRKLWERRKTDDDFLSLRLGSGRLPMLAPLEYPQRDFEMDEDPLLEEMYELAETPVYLEHAPVMNSFIENFVCGVLGQREIVLSFVKGLIMQLAMLHSYDEVKLVFLSGDSELGKLEFVRYLPHIWNDQKDFRFLAVNAGEAYQISEYLSNEIGEDLAKQRELKQILKNRPYYVVVALDKRVFDSMEVLKDVMQADQNCGVSVLAVFDDLPKECIKIFDLKPSGNHSVVYLKQIDKENDTFQSDRYDSEAAFRSMRSISNINLRMVSQAYSLPKSISFLEMYGVGRVEDLNVQKRWRDSDSEKSLSVPVGVDTSGALFTLDLHEKFQGPHGLVAGMTGSGKSEFIITYILSLAVNFHPDDVAFVLIDYKGGGLAGAFEDPDRGIYLPHLAGTITNLDGPSIQRSLMSIQSELKRRQRIFNEAKSRFNEGTMDIYSYQKLYHAQKKTQQEREKQWYGAPDEEDALEPLPHLLIISDEFAELKKQESEFMDQLISAARIGRSLGVHLVLATQKPSGVVDDQIWSNTKFRVCLRVQDRGDSFDMLKRPEAAELRDTGRFYLQVGYNEYFALGQSAYCGGDYIPQDEVVVQKDDVIQVVDSVGQNIAKRRPTSDRAESDQKQIMAIVRHLMDIAEEEQIKPRPLWTKALDKQISLADLIEEYRIVRSRDVEAVIGLVDDPSSQRQFPLTMNLLHSRNLLIAGESGSGKTTMLQTILYHVATNYSPDDVNFYILDFSSRNLGVFKNLPHCGAFLTDEDEDKLDRMFALIRELIDERRKLFAEAEVSSFEAYREIAPLPLILFIIDNVSFFEELEGSYQRNNVLGDLMRGGVGYGIKTIYTISQINDCPMRLRREAGNKIALRARDRYAYSDILDSRCLYEPVDTPGRGICVIEDSCYEFQTALANDAESEKQRMAQIRLDLEKVENAPSHVKKLTEQPIKAKTGEPTADGGYEAFCENFPTERIPLGYYDGNQERKVAVPLQQLHTASLYFGNSGGILPVVRNLLYAFRREKADVVIVRRAGQSVFTDTTEYLQEALSEDTVQVLDSTIPDIEGLTDRIYEVWQKNKAFCETYCQEHDLGDWKTPEAARQWRKYVRENSRPLMIVFESLYDTLLAMDTPTAAGLMACFPAVRGFNIYPWGLFYPDDAERVEQSLYPCGKTEEGLASESKEIVNRRVSMLQITGPLRQEFNPDQFALLFGGQFHKQNVIAEGILPEVWASVRKPCSPETINRLLLHYHGKTQDLVMPCGDFMSITGDADEQEII